ncbi:Yip1 family protein [Shimia sp. W99]|uniref:Yip1 domain-containing protein n=1 Tax=Shimia aestuarii TaxID=254406 RepID=A0A1I4P2A2_9RHOB|nr:Yip1 family protein [Shimia aestuarii]SFM21902.1 Yip1 domain-containing protein [Shimia aestuarii]
MSAFLRQLFMLTIYNPPQAGQVLVAQQVDRAAGWLILALAVILNTLAYFLSITLFPVPAEIALPLLTSPVLVCMVLGSVTVIFVFAFYWVGRAMGGQARFEDILLMMGWLQYMRLAVQLGALVLMIFLPGLAQIFVMATGLYGAWIVLNFLKVAHGFDTMGKAVMMLVFTLVGMTVGLSLFLSLIGVTAMGFS